LQRLTYVNRDARPGGQARALMVSTAQHADRLSVVLNPFRGVRNPALADRVIVGRDMDVSAEIPSWTNWH